jgi:hypothetical protein
MRMRAIRCEKAWFSIRVLSETRFAQMEFAIRFEMELFASRFLERRPCGSPELLDSMCPEIRTLAIPSRSERSVP